MSALVIARFVHVLALMLAFGASAFLALNAPREAREALAPRIGRLVLIAACVALVAALAWFAAETAALVDDAAAAFDPASLAAVGLDTAFGRVWLARLALSAAFVVAAARGGSWGGRAFLAGLALASLGLVGHAAMREGVAGAVQRANAALHLLCAGAWLGGLVPFVACLDLYGAQRRRKPAILAMMRYSRAGHAFVAALILTGLANVALVSGRLPWPPDAPWRALLDVKIAIVATMVALALTNRYVLVPRLKRDAGALAALRRASLAEIGLGALVVALVAAFALFDPA